MKYAPLAVRKHPSDEPPEWSEIRTAAKQFIMERLNCGDIDELECERLLAELGLRSA